MNKINAKIQGILQLAADGLSANEILTELDLDLTSRTLQRKLVVLIEAGIILVTAILPLRIISWSRIHSALNTVEK